MAPGPGGADRQHAAGFLSGLPEGTYRRRLEKVLAEEEEPEPIPKAVDAAADLIALGAPGWLLLTSRDPTERLALAVLAEKVADRREQEREALAARIIERLVKALK